MKQTTEQVKSLLENSSILSKMERLMEDYPNNSFQETHITEAYDGLLEIIDLLWESIENGSFEKLPFAQRQAINTHLNNLTRSSGNINQVIQNYNSLSYVIYNSRLHEITAKEESFEEKVNEINSLRRRYKKLLRDVDDIESIKESIDVIKSSVDNNSESIFSTNNRVEELKGKLENDEKELSKSIKSISDAEQDIENRKKEILAFASNIKENEQKLNKILSETAEQIENDFAEKSNRAKELITEAENALELKQTEGIAAAYSSRLKKIAGSKYKRNWLYGAAAFVVFTLFFGYLLTGGKLWGLGFERTENIGLIIGRIAVSAIGISGAVFCAQRYVQLVNLEEDYEYKVVLTKSILAFARKIKEIDEGKVAEYLTQVLNQLHQDPLRERKSKSNDGNKLSVDQIDRIAGVLQKTSQE